MIQQKMQRNMNQNIDLQGYVYICIYVIITTLIITVKNGLAKKREGSRKQIKEKKNRGKKVWGVGRRIARHKAKKSES